MKRQVAFCDVHPFAGSMSLGPTTGRVDAFFPQNPYRSNPWSKYIERFVNPETAIYENIAIPVVRVLLGQAPADGT